MKILLCGFMGSGKTTIYKRIMENSREVIGLDLDDLVRSEIGENNEDLGQAIRRVGFEKFREVEEKLLINALKQSGKLLISLGGGSLSPKILKLIENEKGIRLVWVNTDFETCWERISSSKERPLVEKGKAAMEELFREREVVYRNASKILNKKEQESLSSFEELDDGC